MSNPSDEVRIKNRELMAGCMGVLQEEFHLLNIEERYGRQFLEDTAKQAGTSVAVAALTMLTTVCLEALQELEAKLKHKTN